MAYREASTDPLHQTNAGLGQAPREQGGAPGGVGREDTRELHSGFHNWRQSGRISLELHLILFLSHWGFQFCCLTLCITSPWQRPQDLR